MTVVCDGITSDILPGIDDSKVPGFYTEPYGPHAVGNFKVWTPREHLADMMSFVMLHRGDLVSYLWGCYFAVDIKEIYFVLCF